MTFPTFSIVINTLNRGALLQRTLQSFGWLRYRGSFEVIVVNGPSTDDSAEVIESWGSRIRAANCDVANISVSRNIGICMARGEIVAFIDDDAIPEPEWLEHLAQAYADPQVGAAGGLVFDHTGYAFQSQYCVVDRFGRADFSPRGPTPHLAFPRSFRFPHLLGTNASFRRSALLEIGGFDEEFEYFLDETDVCLRIVDAGFMVAQLPNAYVHHKYAPSKMRDAHRVTRHHYPIIKNQLYFLLKHARAYVPLEIVLEQHRLLVDLHRSAVARAIAGGFLSPGVLETFGTEVDRALEVGLRRGFEGVRSGALIDSAKRKRWNGTFRPFSTIAVTAPTAVVLVSRDYAPGHAGGIATFTRDLARALGALGHLVHVVAASPDIDRVDFEQGVWLHRVVTRGHPHTAAAIELGVPQHIWDWAATALDEVRRIAAHRTIDVVEAPIWDCQGIALALDRTWPLVTSLQTSMHFWLDSHPELRSDPGWMELIGTPIQRVERYVMLHSDAVRSISHSIQRDIERAYGFRFEPTRLAIEPLGIDNIPTADHVQRQQCLTVLFVGRQEHRKGIDVLLQAIPAVVAAVPGARFRLVGDNTLPGPGGSTFQAVFLATEPGQACAGQITFEGVVDEETLQRAYAECDLFVAPSRFESFGLIFVEAMRAGKPVVGCQAGGVPEIVSHGVSGLLVPPDDADALARAMIELLGSAPLRSRMGNAGRRIFEESFTADRMARASLALYRRAATQRDCREKPDHD